MLLDLPVGRYRMVEIAREWLQIFAKSDEAKELSISELVKKAMDDIISGKVTEKDIQNAKAKGAAAPVVEKKEEEEAEEKAEKKEEKEKDKDKGKDKKKKEKNEKGKK